VKQHLQEATVIEWKAQEMKRREIFLKEAKVIEDLKFKEVLLQAIEISQKTEEIQIENKKTQEEVKGIQEETDEVKLRLNICGQKPM